MRYTKLLTGLLLALPMLSIGCTNCEFDVTRPEEFARHVGSKQDVTINRDPLSYTLRAVEGRLVIQIHNPTDDTITLDGQRSSVVDPQGQSHPLRTQTMAPNSFIKLVLPPIRPRLERTGPTLGIGVGGVFGDARGRRHLDDGLDGGFYDEPRYLVIVDDDNTLYWDWDGQTTIRFLLTFNRKTETFSQEFVVARKKM